MIPSTEDLSYALTKIQRWIEQQVRSWASGGIVGIYGVI